jgi:hypothetical protein
MLKYILLLGIVVASKESLMIAGILRGLFITIQRERSLVKVNLSFERDYLRWSLNILRV